MANQKPFHLSVVGELKQLQEWQGICTLLDLIAITKVPDGEGKNLVTEAIDVADRMDDVDVNKSAAAVIIAHDGRSILAERFTADTKNEVLGEMVRLFNEQKDVELIVVP